MKRDTWFIPFVSIITMLIAMVIFFDLAPFLRGPGQWHWVLRQMPEKKFLLLTAGAFFLFVAFWYLIGCRLPVQPNRRQAWLSCGILLVLALLIQATILMTYRPNPFDILFERLASNPVSGYLTAYQLIDDLPTFLREYPERLATFTHTNHLNKPPGILLIYWGVGQAMSAMPWISETIGEYSGGILADNQWLIIPTTSELATNSIIALVTPLISVLAIWPAYGIASRRWGTRAGWIAAGLVALIPARLAFAPQMDTIYPFSALLAFYLVDTGLRSEGSIQNEGRLQSNKPIWFYAAGLVLSVATFMSPINFVMVALIGLYIVLIFIKDRSDSFLSRTLINNLILFGLGVLTIWFLYWIIFGVSIIDIILALDPDTIFLGRSYWFWLVGSLVDFFLFAGFAAAVLASSWSFINRYTKLPHAVSALAWAIAMRWQIAVLDWPAPG